MLDNKIKMLNIDNNAEYKNHLFYKIGFIFSVPIFIISVISFINNSQFLRTGRASTFFDFAKDGVEIMTYSAIFIFISLLIASIEKKFARVLLFWLITGVGITSFLFLVLSAASESGGNMFAGLGLLLFIVFILPGILSFWICFVVARYIFNHHKLLKVITLLLFSGILINIFISFRYLEALFLGTTS